VSYCRAGKYSDVYLIGTREGQVECCGCCLIDDHRFFSYTGTASEMLLHLDAHLEHGDKVPHYAIERLTIDERAEKLYAAGYVPQESRWQLPRQLGLTRQAATTHRYIGRYPEDLDEYPIDYHCVPHKSVTWVVAWAERIAWLPVKLDERRRALRLAAADPDRRAALEAALATERASNRLILDICSP
jgi:hypothetical protein